MLTKKSQIFDVIPYARLRNRPQRPHRTNRTSYMILRRKNES